MRHRASGGSTPYHGGTGFTLVEIMIVVAIIALLAAIAIPNVLRGRTTATEAASIGNLRALMSSLEMYRSVNNAYPVAGAWQANMYTTADPDYGPPSFNVAMTGQTVSSYNYTYTGVLGGAAYDLDSVPSTPLTTGTRRFRADETGVMRHCTCLTVACAAPSAAAWNAEATIDASPSPCG